MSANEKEEKMHRMINSFQSMLHYATFRATLFRYGATKLQDKFQDKLSSVTTPLELLWYFLGCGLGTKNMTAIIC